MREQSVPDFHPNAKHQKFKTIVPKLNLKSLNRSISLGIMVSTANYTVCKYSAAFIKLGHLNERKSRSILLDVSTMEAALT